MRSLAQSPTLWGPISVAVTYLPEIEMVLRVLVLVVSLTYGVIQLVDYISRKRKQHKESHRDR